MNSADFARNAVQQAQIARVNAILGLEPEALPVAMSSASKPETQNKRNHRHHHAPPPKSQPAQSQPTSSEASEVSKEQVLKDTSDASELVGRWQQLELSLWKMWRKWRKRIRTRI